MTKTIFKCLLASLLIPVCACQNKDYTFTGTIEGVQDGDTVFIARLDKDKWDVCDTLIVKNKEFKMSGKADSCVIYSYWLDNNNGSYQGFFFAEPGNITLSVNQEKSVLKGTHLNDIYQQTSDSLYVFGDRIAALYEEDPTSPEVAKKGEALNLEIRNFLRKQISDNIDNQVGFFLLITNATLFTPEEMEQMIDALPEQTRHNPAVQNISATIEKLKRSAVGQKYTDFSLNDPEGKSFRISDLIGKNKITVLDFWASWCGPCMAEMPDMIRLYDKFHNLGVEFIGVSLDTDGAAWKNAIRTKGMTWPQGSELKEWQENEGARTYNVEGIPYTVILSQNGEILAKGLRSAELEKFLENALSQKE